MHSLAEELRELQSRGALDAGTAEQALALESRNLFSVFDELRAALYAAVALVVAGVGILIKEHLDRIGPLTLILALALAAAACYVPAIRARSRGMAPATVADYVLLLGALIVSADVGFAESQFHLLGANWSRHLLMLAALHALTAYVFGSRLVLSVALTSLAGWFGIERGPGNLAPWEFATPELGLRALTCAAVILAWRSIDRSSRGVRFRPVFEHFAANLAFWGALGWCSNDRWRVVGVLALLVLAAIAIHKALRSGAESFAVYGVGYGAVGISLVIAEITELSVLGAVLVLAMALSAAATLRYLHDLLKAGRA